MLRSASCSASCSASSSARRSVSPLRAERGLPLKLQCVGVGAAASTAVISAANMVAYQSSPSSGERARSPMPPGGSKLPGASCAPPLAAGSVEEPNASAVVHGSRPTAGGTGATGGGAALISSVTPPITIPDRPSVSSASTALSNCTRAVEVAPAPCSMVIDTMEPKWWKISLTPSAVMPPPRLDTMMLSLIGGYPIALPAPSSPPSLRLQPPRRSQTGPTCGCVLLLKRGGERRRGL
jgi:hypothetical protein